MRTSRHDDNELWLLSQAGIAAGAPRPEDERGRGDLEEALRIAWSETHEPEPGTGGRSFEARRRGRGPVGAAAREQKVVYESPDNRCVIEAQDFYDNDSKLTFSCYEPKGMASVMSVDLASGEVENMSKAPGTYNEPEGIFPDGKYTCVEADRQVQTLGGEGGFRNIDIWKLRLDGTGKDFVRLTHFNDYEGWKASNPVVSTDGRFMAFQVAHTADEAGVGYGIMMMKLP